MSQILAMVWNHLELGQIGAVGSGADWDFAGSRQPVGSTGQFGCGLPLDGPSRASSVSFPGSLHGARAAAVRLADPRWVASTVAFLEDLDAMGSDAAGPSTTKGRLREK